MAEELIEDRYKFLKSMSMGNTCSQITKNAKDFHLMYVRIGKRKGRGSGKIESYPNENVSLNFIKKYFSLKSNLFQRLIANYEYSRTII